MRRRPDGVILAASLIVTMAADFSFFLREGILASPPILLGFGVPRFLVELTILFYIPVDCSVNLSVTNSNPCSLVVWTILVAPTRKDGVIRNRSGFTDPWRLGGRHGGYFG